MSPSKVLGLPPLPPQLKTISPFLQRAEELKSQEPVIAYWCAYYAAQIGISLKAKDMGSRNLLLGLLDLLEHMKTDIGPNDAVDIEVASAAYVENFALKVFGAADDEDRRGEANRATAKKFVAASNFLEVLKIFPTTEISESNEEKIRYAKWKAADIAKAFREGRKPIAGPAGSDVATDPSLPPSQSTPNTSATVAILTPPHSPPRPVSPLSPIKHTPSSPVTTVDLPLPQVHANEPHTHPQVYANEPCTPPRHGHLSIPGQVDGDVTPGGWSTIATPGTAPPTDGEWSIQGGWEESPLRGRAPKWELLDQGTTVDGAEDLSHYQPPSLPTPEFSGNEFRKHPLSWKEGHAKRDSSGSIGSGSPRLSRPSAPNRLTPPFAPSVPAESVPTATSPPPLDPLHFGGAPPRAPPSVPVDVDVELTPAVIAKAQKHARFAISALDYEDGKQAKKELRTALAILGSR